MFSRLSLRYRIALVIFLLEAIMLGSVLSVSLSQSRQTAEDFNTASQQASLKLLSNLSITVLLTGEYSDYQLYIEDIYKQPSIVRILLANTKDNVVASTRVSDVGYNISDRIDRSEGGWRVEPVKSAAGVLGTLAVQFSDKALLKSYKNTRNLAVSIAIAGMVIIGLVGLATGFILTRRLNQVTNAARKFADGDTNARSQVPGYDEVAALSRNVDKMAASVTEQQNMLREQSEYIELLMSSTAEAIYGVDKNGICTFVNPACINMLGYKNENDLVGKKIHNLIHHSFPGGEPYPIEKCAIRLATVENKPCHRDDEVHWRPDGTSFPVEYWSHPIIKDNELIGSVVTFIDISERKKAEQDLQRASKLDALGKLTGGIAHDFNNTLGIILGYSELAMMDLDKSSALYEHLRMIYEAAERGSSLTNKLLGFTRKKSSETIPCKLNDILLEEKLMLEKTLTPSININLNLEENLWLTEIDKNDFVDAFVNLCINARHAMNNSGEITLTTKNIDDNSSIPFAVIPGGKYVLLSVSDNGSGIETDVLQNIFDPFFTTKGKKGTGLGLAQVYGFIKRSGGFVDVKSVKGKGTTFNLYFPRLEEKEIHAIDNIESQGVENIRPGAKMLIVDDEAMLANYIEQSLAKAGYKTQVVNSAEQAINVLEQEKFDLVISDIIMPGMSGLDLKQHIETKYSSLPVLLISGYSEEFSDTLHDAKILRKPFKKEQLFQHINELLTTVTVVETS